VRQLPDFEQVNAMPAILKGTVVPEYIDMNGHMNIKHYLDFGANTTAALCDDALVTTGYIAERGMGVFTAEHHLQYLGELREGDAFSTHARTLNRSDKAIHMVAFLLDRERNKISNIFETLLVHMDMTTRRPTPFPADVAALFDLQITSSNSLDWKAPISGAIGIRR
jgi:acyl-CoA thioester hydrolase